jgi:F-type H+-transporting ATPase subunit b
MKPSKKQASIIFLSVAVIMIILLGPQLVAAADSPDNWRKTYDQILLWINFGIFVFLIVKYLRVPLKKFIADKQNELERKISRLEDEKNEADRKIQEILRAVDESRAEFGVMKQKIIEQGEIKKQTIIEEARQKSQAMLNESQLRVENQIRRARKKLRDELVDAAVELALEKLPQIVTPDDNRKMIQAYIAGAARK